MLQTSRGGERTGSSFELVSSGVPLLFCACAWAYTHRSDIYMLVVSTGTVVTRHVSADYLFLKLIRRVNQIETQ